MYEDRQGSLQREQNALNSRQQQTPQAELAKLDEQARRAGYQNYEQMRAHLMRRQQEQGEAQADPNSGRGRQAQQGMRDAGSLHPANLLKYVLEKMKGVMQ